MAINAFAVVLFNALLVLVILPPAIIFYEDVILVKMPKCKKFKKIDPGLGIAEGGEGLNKMQAAEDGNIQNA